MRNKKFKYLFFTLSMLPFATVSCVNYSKQPELNKIINNVDAITSVSDDNKNKTHKTIIDTILNNAYRFDSLKIQEYVNSQTSPDSYQNLVNQFKEITNNFKNSNDKKKYALEQNDFFSKNWYFILNNLDKIELTFVEFVTVDLAKNYSTSEEYKEEIIPKTNRIKNGIDRGTWEFENHFLEAIREGIESTELGDVVVYYIRKNKLIFRVIINNLRAENTQPEVQLRPINWYFGESKANTISPSLISNVVHQLFIHGYERGRQEFEVEMVKKQKYGSPSFVFLTWKDKNV